MGCVYAADSVWQGVVGGYYQGSEVENDGGGGEGEARQHCFHFDIRQILPMCICATAMTTFLEMVHELICMCLY